MKRALLLLALVGCDDLDGLGGTPPPLATISIRTTGEAPAGGNLRVAIVWGEQWLPEPLCFLPPESPELEAVVAAGCRDPLSFTPERVGASVPITPGEIAELPLVQLPAADVMVGDVTSRVGFASIVVFDDVDNDQTLELTRPRRLPSGGVDGGGGGGGMGGMMEEEDDDDEMPRDRVVGASFVSMQQADRRLAFREGDFSTTGFYPRAGCGDPLPNFSIVSAGGFTIDEAIAATLAGELPQQDPASCAEDELDATVVEIPFRPTPEVAEVACEQRRNDSSVRYLDPPLEAPPMMDRSFACAKIPSLLGEEDTGIVQFVISNKPDERCMGLTHYTLVGCDNGRLDCDNPEWDYRATPPPWWPCPESL